MKHEMLSDNHYDIIIAGAGAAGLSLLWYLLQTDENKKYNILLADISFEPKNDKTWCFWDDTNLPDRSLIYHQWSDLEVRAKGRKLRESLQQCDYFCVRSADFAEHILLKAKESDNVTFLEGKILDFTNNAFSAVMKTDVGDFQADQIFQSVLKPSKTDQMKSDISLKQHFLGWEIETIHDQFDPDRALLMDFEYPQNDGVTFFYVLPFSKTKALVEYTIFSEEILSRDEYELEMKTYLSLRYGLQDHTYTVIRSEQGVIPMEDQGYPTRYCDCVYNIGTMGGVTKPSSGYAFTRILNHSKILADAIINEKPIPERAVSSYRFRVYDMMLLYLLKNDPDISIQIFHDLFSHNKFDRILQFLDEKTHFGQELAIFSTVPYLPFLKSIWKMKHRIFTGA